MSSTGRDRSFALKLAAAVAVPVFIHSCYIADLPDWTIFSVPLFALAQVLVLLMDRSFNLALVGWSLALVGSAVLLLTATGVALTIPMLALPTLLNLIFMVVFGGTLRAGREPLITRICRLDRGSVPPPLDLYTRRLTQAWTALFAFAAVGATALAAADQPLAWSWFSNIACPLAMLSFFVGEHVFRQHRFGHASLARTLSIMLDPRVWTDAGRPAC